MGDRKLGWVFGALTALLLGVAAVVGGRAVPGAGVGGVDPLGAAIGMTALAVSVWTGGLTVRSMHWQETNAADLAERLARAVLAAEQRARQQLLGVHDRAIDVRFVFCPAPAHNAAGAAEDGRLEAVADYYRRLEPRRMVITGAPGAGKTVLAVQLMLLLLDGRAPEDPVPVHLSLAGWDTDRPLKEWISSQLISTYRFHRAAAETLVEGGLVLPVLDGLDEMDAGSERSYSSRAADALRALNVYQQGVGKAQLVVTCRSGPYSALEALRVWAHDAARVEICPVDARTACRFLTERVEDPVRWRTVHDALTTAPQGPLATGLSTPWRSTLAVITYDERRPRDGVYHRDPGALLDPALNTPDAVGEHLLDQLIPAVTAPLLQPCETSYSAEQVRAWLTVLARYLDGNAATGRRAGGRVLSGTDIVLHELWPLAGDRGPRVVSSAVVAVAGLAAAATTILQAPVGVPGSHLVGVAGLASFAMSVVWADIWPDPNRTDLRSPRTPRGRRQLAYAFAAGIMSALAGGLVFGFAGGIALGFTVALTSGLVGTVAYGLVARLDAAGTAGSVNPKTIVRNNLVAGLVIGLTFGPAFALVAGFTAGPVAAVACGLTAGLSAARSFGPTAGLGFGLTTGLGFDAVGQNGLTVGLAFGLMGGLAAGAAGLRYVGLLVCTRKRTGRWLPWRLGRFLTWCYGAGLIRIAGSAYQFRHRELQDFLARRTS